MVNNWIIKYLFLGVLVFFYFSINQIYAQDGAVLYQTKTCIACHGLDAKTPLLPEYPKLAGQPKEYLLSQMLAIKSAERNNGNSPAMLGVMPLVNEAELELIAGYLSQLKYFGDE